MRHIFFISILFISVLAAKSQNLTVNQTTYSVQQLIENVLINSVCAEINNITFSTGTNYGEGDGIGYFSESTGAFPFAEGIIMASGNATIADGPNNQDNAGSGSMGWPGDTDLNLLSGSNTFNATIIEFDFVPYVDEISFEFLMASEEYGNGSYECIYSDIFAFILTHPDGTKSNLAVIPGTNIPVLVTTVHPANSTCDAQNEQYFSQYVPTGAAPIEYNGFTTSITAKSPVLAGQSYHIKLGVADAGDGQYDTAVFLKGGSFILDVNLGEDLLIATGTAECVGNVVTLNTNSSIGSHVWYKDGVFIAGETSSTLTVTQPGVYKVQLSYNSSCQVEDEITIEFISPPQANPPQDLSLCSSTGIAEFDLDANNAYLLGTQDPTQFVISYHLTQSDAENDLGQLLSTNYQNTSNPQTIYARIEDLNGKCFDTAQFQISTTPIQWPTPVPNLYVCDDDFDGIASFQLTSMDAQVTSLSDVSSTNVSVSYFLSFADASSGNNPVSSPFLNTVPNQQEIFALLVNNDLTSCTGITSFNLIVSPLPTTVTMTSLVLCDDDYDGQMVFDLSTKSAEAMNGQTGVSISYHDSQSAADSGSSALPLMYTSTSKTIYIRLERDLTGCYSTMPMNLVVMDKPVIPSIVDYELCDNNNTGDEIETFDLTAKTVEIANGQNVSVTYYTSATAAESATGPITTLSNSSNPQTVYLRSENNTTGCYSTGSFEIVVNALPDLQNATLIQCDEDGTPDGFTIYNLHEADQNITVGGNTTGFTYTYYLSQSDAQSGNNPQNPSPFINTVNPQTLYAKVENAVTGCVSYATVTLDVTATDIGNAGLETCDDDYDGMAEFTLSDANPAILQNMPAGLDVAFYRTLEDAQLEQNELPDQYTNEMPYSQVIYIRVENNNDCFGIANMTITVNPLPAYNPVIDQELCSATPNQNIVDLSAYNSTILGSQNAANYTITYYDSQANADSGQNPINGLYTTQSNPDTIYVRVEDNTTHCYITSINFDLLFHANPDFVVPADYEVCDTFPIDQVETFDLSSKVNEITGGDTQTTVSFHLDQIAADNNTSPLPSTYVNIQNPQTIYVRIEDENTAITGCYSMTSFNLQVLSTPAPGLFPQDLELCDDFTPGDGQEIFDLTQNATYILNGESGVLLSYYESQQDAEQMINAIVDPTQYANTSSPQTIYVRDTNQSTGCYSIVSFAIMVHPLPEATPVTDYIVCELNTDQLYAFDLSSKDSEILNGQDPAMFEVSYYTTQANAQAGTNALLSPYTNTSNPQTIYAVITNTQTDCRILGMSFVIEVQESAQANPDAEPILYEVCDQTGANDGRAEFDLSTLDAEVLDGQNPANYAVSYHLSQADAQANVNPLSNPYSNTSNPQTIYARVSNVSTTTSICYATTSLELQVNLLPIFDLEPSYILCVNTNGTEVVGLPVMETGLSPVDYSFEWRFNNTVIAGSTGNSHTATQAGNYSVVVTNRTTLCENTDQTVVNSSEPPTLTAEVTSAAFSDNATIQAQVSGSGNYELSIDNGPWTTETLFTGLSEGIHEVWARDIIGCGQARVELLVIGYPPFFTPNGDGYNDTWNIFSLSDQLESKIRIFDRYGKLLKEIRPQSRGWDGTYNGELMPSSDYWFTVNYRDPDTDTVKQYKAHFTLKR